MEYKKILAKHLLSYLKSGLIIGIGSGSTMEIFVDEIQSFLKNNPMDLSFVSSSNIITEKLRGLNVLDLTGVKKIDLTIDGLDYVNLDTGLVLKGNGGALYLEKKLALKSEKVVLASDYRKLDFNYCNKLMLEYNPEFIDELSSFKIKARENLSDSGNLIVEVPLKNEGDIFAWRDALNKTQGFIDDGDFSGLVDEVCIIYENGDIKKFNILE